MTTARKLMTAEEFAQLPADGRRLELVDGEIVEMAPINFQHNHITIRFGGLLDAHASAHDLGSVAGGDPGIKIRRNPDVVLAPRRLLLCVCARATASPPLEQRR